MQSSIRQLISVDSAAEEIQKGARTSDDGHQSFLGRVECEESSGKWRYIVETELNSHASRFIFDTEREAEDELIELLRRLSDQ